MHRRSKRPLLLIALVLLLGTWTIGQNSNTTPPKAAPGVSLAPPNAPAESQPQQPATVPPALNQPGDAVQVPEGQAPEERRGDVYVFKKEVDEVTLHATVVDDHNRLVTNLARNDFTVLEDGKPQKITSFRREDIPVAMGVVIDNSGSMRDKRPAVNAAAINLVQSSNPQDKVFVVNFNEEYFLDQDYTSAIPKL
ncbi:MAG: VWA domain-containing protein, partial [Acidobacteriota bacterium]|nr:VWA domain-containing protein [Acidobacteriota bacterium]